MHVDYVSQAHHAIRDQHRHAHGDIQRHSCRTTLYVDAYCSACDPAGIRVACGGKAFIDKPTASCLGEHFQKQHNPCHTGHTSSIRCAAFKAGCSTKCSRNAGETNASLKTTTEYLAHSCATCAALQLQQDYGSIPPVPPASAHRKLAMSHSQPLRKHFMPSPPKALAAAINLHQHYLHPLHAGTCCCQKQSEAQNPTQVHLQDT